MLKKISRIIAQWLSIHSESGVSTVEKAVILALLAFVITGLANLLSALNNIFIAITARMHIP